MAEERPGMHDSGTLAHLFASISMYGARNKERLGMTDLPISSALHYIACNIFQLILLVGDCGFAAQVYCMV